MQPRTSAWPVLIVLTAINLVNYLDRYVISALLPLIKADLDISDAGLGGLATAFIVSYMLFSAPAGLLGDRYPRKYLIAAAIFVWSLATMASGLARNYNELLWARAFTGIGEAGYATVAPAIISDGFHRDRRGSVLSIFSAALPVGSALGFVLGGYWGVHFGWRSAFYLAGVPGVLLAIVALFLREPARGLSDGSAGRRATSSSWRTAWEIAGIASFRYINLGWAAYTFAIGGLAFWAPTYLNRVRGVELSHATFLFGISTVVAGFAGTLGGGALCDRLRGRVPGAYGLVPGLALIIAFPLLILFFDVTTAGAYWTMLFVAEIFLFLGTGPLNAAVVNVVLPEQRALAMALNILIIHMLGDALSPLVIGRLSDAYGLQAAAEAISVATLIAGVLMIHGSRSLERDEQSVAMRIEAHNHTEAVFESAALTGSVARHKGGSPPDRRDSK